MKALKYILSLALALGFFACEDELELQPFQSLSTTDALADITGMTAALYGAYDGLQNLGWYGRDFQVQADIEANLVYLSINNSNRFVLNYLYNWNQDSEGSIWTIGYATILRVNNVINNVDNVEASAAVKNQLRGEALAIRALAYFDLVRLYGRAYTQGNPGSDLGVPIVLESKIDEPARNTVEEVYNQIISDLNTARGLITDQGIYNFSPNAVDALLARVYLYKGDWSNAAAKAGAVINSGDYTLASDFQAMFDAPGSSEEIFTLRFVNAENRGSDNLGSIYNPDSYGDIRPTTDYINLFEAGDQRAGMVYNTIKGGVDAPFHSKYLSQDGVPGLHSPKILRLGEMHLIRIEANLNLGNTADALAEINALRGARGASALAAVTMDDLFDERLRELAFEGHAKFDYFRMGRNIVRQQCNTGAELSAPCVIEASSHLGIYPIPQVEMQVNQNMVQNSGY